MAALDGNDIASLTTRLAELEVERRSLTERLERAKSRPVTGSIITTGPTSVTGESTGAEKITLFRRLFSGRTDVFPIRWENRNNGKSGYAPA